MKIRFKYGILIILYFQVFTLTAQRSNTYQQLSKKDGLSQSSVFAIVQDNDGFMWFGTRDGLNKYDGYDFKVYKNKASNNSLVGNDIRNLHLDNRN